MYSGGNLSAFRLNVICQVSGDPSQKLPIFVVAAVGEYAALSCSHPVQVSLTATHTLSVINLQTLAHSADHYISY